MESAVRLSFGSQYKFPLKLMRVANDGVLIQWADDERRLIVKERTFEDNVMEMYPGFVQVETFHNLRRLFRDYNFRFRILQRASSLGRVVEFNHPCFSKNDFRQILNVRKRPRPRKLNFQRKPKSRPLATSSPKFKRKIRPGFHAGPVILKTFGERAIRKHFKSSDNRSGVDLLGIGNNSYYSLPVDDYQDSTHGDLRTPDKSYELFSGAEISSRSRLGSRTRSTRRLQRRSHLCTRVSPEHQTFFGQQKCDRDRLALLQIYAKNELTESQFWEVITRNMDKPCSEMSWDMIKEFLDSLVHHELSPLHFKGFYYEVPLSEM